MQLQRGLVLCVVAVLGITQSIAEAGMPPPAPGFTLVAQDDCGNPNQQPHLVTGGVWAFPEDERESLALDDPRLLTCAHGILQGARVVFRFFGFILSTRRMTVPLGLRPMGRSWMRHAHCRSKNWSALPFLSPLRSTAIRPCLCRSSIPLDQARWCLPLNCGRTPLASWGRPEHSCVFGSTGCRTRKRN